MQILQWELNYHDQKIRRTPTPDIQKHWTAVSTLLGLISSVYRDLHHLVCVEFLGQGNSIHNIIPLYKKEKCRNITVSKYFDVEAVSTETRHTGISTIRGYSHSFFY